MNGDQLADIIVGIDRYDGGQDNEGQAIVYHGLRDAQYAGYQPMVMR